MKSKLNVLSLSFDNALLDSHSIAFKRQVFYASLFKSYTIILCTNQNHAIKEKNNLSIYSTGSRSRWFYLLDLLKIYKHHFSQRKFDLITTQDPFFLGLCGVILKILTGLPLNIQIHSQFFDSNHFRNENLQSRISYFLGILVLYFSDSVRVRNNRIAQDVLKRFPKLKGKVCYVGMPIDELFWKNTLALKRDSNLIVTVGRITEQKNFSLLIAAMASLTKQNPNLKLWIIGEGEQKKQLIDLVSRLGLTNKVFFKGRKSTKEIKNIFDKANLFVLPSNHEGWPGVCLEAASRKLPIVMTNVGSAGELVINNYSGLVTPVGNREKLIEAISYALMHKTRMCVFAGRAWSLAKKDTSYLSISRQLKSMYSITVNNNNE